MTKDEALRMAIEVLNSVIHWGDATTVDIDKTVQACKDALEQPAWQGLSDDEISHLKYLHVDYELFDEGEYGTDCNVYVDDFARAIEQALKEKNG